MRNAAKTILVSLLLLTFMAGSVMCCCLRDFVASKVKHSDCCNKSAKSDHAKKDCDGCKASLTKPDARTIINGELVNAADSIANSVVKPQVLLFASRHIYSTAPPQQISQPPLFIQFHSLRL